MQVAPARGGGAPLSPGGFVAKARTSTAANVGFEAELWKAADALRGSMDSGEYKHVVLGLLFLKYISDVFEE
jgi:type I restriction enzyme M protein